MMIDSDKIYAWIQSAKNDVYEADTDSDFDANRLGGMIDALEHFEMVLLDMEREAEYE